MKKNKTDGDSKTHPKLAGNTGPHGEDTIAGPETDRRAPYRPKYAPLWENAITLLGLFLAAASIILLLMFALYSMITKATNPYLDIVGYLIVPSVLVMSVLAIPFGILFRSWRRHRRNPEERIAFRFPRVDLNDPTQRRAAKWVFVGMLVLLPVVAVSGYHGYHFTDSADFCSKTCHTAMHPQATTYEHSAHARVSCAECHIGSGASWFVKAKLSGLRQVLAMYNDSFPRPIPSAITDLRPARETCEQCHWPKKFYGAQLKELVTFRSDEANTRHEIDMLLRIGGGDETIGRAEGIHKHMALAGNIEYVATDDKLQKIPWVKYTDRAGDEWIYRSDGKPSSDPPPQGQKRTLDCMDCHNRPAHKFRTPIEAVDLFLDSGTKIDTSLPYIKREAVKALSEPYPDKETAERRIGGALTEFYKREYPEVWRDRRVAVNHAIDSVREIYGQITFPEMRVDWRTYPDNIGHKYSPGCFRCHEGRHVDQRGEVLSHACDICHTFLNPVTDEEGRSVVQRGDFVHPIELEGSHAALRCDRCHDGGPAPLPTCVGCHAEVTAFRDGTSAVFARFAIEADPMADLDCDACHDLSVPTTVEAINPMCLDCHDEDERFETLLADWKVEVGGLMAQARTVTGETDPAIFEALRRAGPLHNIEATRKVLEALATGTPGPEGP